MTARLDADPYRNFRFRVDIDDIGVTAFTEVVVPEATTEDVTYREGTDIPTMRHLSGQQTHGNIELKRGIRADLALWDWYKTVIDGGADANRKNITITVIDEEGGDKAQWTFTECWPIKYAPSELSSEGNDVMIETVEITYEEMNRVA